MSDDPAVLMYEHQPRLKHHPDSPNSYCGNCGQSWPCQTYRLAERVIAAEVRRDNEFEGAADLLEHLPALVRDKRRREGLTLRQTEDRSGIPLTSISQVELGHRDPTARVAAALLRWIGSGKIK